MKLRNIFALSLLIIILLSACTMNKPICATSNPTGNKVGTYSQTSWLGFPPLANTNSAIAKAAENGGITKIATADHNITWMIFYLKYTTIVTGN